MGWICPTVKRDRLMNQGEKIPFGFYEIIFNKRREWMKAQGLNWKPCATELSGSFSSRGLIENHIRQVFYSDRISWAVYCKRHLSVRNLLYFYCHVGGDINSIDVPGI